MKTIYKSILLASVASSLAVSLYAQKTAAKDTVLNRQVLLERDFNPTLQDASKINTVPAMHEPTVTKANVQFESKQTDYNFGSFPLGDTGAGDVKTAVDYSKKRGYLTLAAGTYANLKGSLGYKIIDTKDDQLDIFVRHTSFNGKLKYADGSADKVKAKYMNNLIKARYQHSFEYLKWYLNANFENTGFNYYGNPFLWGTIYDMNKSQNVNNFGVETGVVSKENNEFVYTGSLSFNHFTTKYGPSIDSDGASGNIIDAKLDIAAPFNSANYVGVRVGLMHQGFSDIDFYSDKSSKNDFFHNLTKFEATPYLSFVGDDYSVSLGVNAGYIFDYKNKFSIAPDIRVKWQFAENTSLYANALGGINDNNYLYILRENRYTNPDKKVNHSRTLVDGSLGIKSGVVKGLEFDVFAGYKYTKSEHLYTMTSVDSWGNVGEAQYVNLGTGHFGAELKTKLIPRTNLSARFVAYFYNVSEDKDYESGIPEFKAWNLPTFTVNLKADVNLIDNLIISADYNLGTGRKAWQYNTEVNMKNINELNVCADYKITDWLSVNVQLNNVLNQKYDTWHGYTQQGFAVMGGAAIKF